MKEIIIFALIGAFSGILGGMGMGGGTALIPLLTIFTSIHQKSAQGINLLSFIPMAVIALFLHFKNGLVRKKNLLWIIIPACISAVGGSVLCLFVSVNLLRRVFGGFLIGLSILQFFADKLPQSTKNKQKTEDKS